MISDDQWVVVGDGPSARTMLVCALEQRPCARTITTNGGILLFCPWRLDYYFLADGTACVTYHDAAVAAHKRGTRWITIARNPKRLRDQGLDGADEFLEFTPMPGCGLLVNDIFFDADLPWGEVFNRTIGATHWKFRRGVFTDARLSGITCLQYAVNNGASEISLVGMDGYGPDDCPRCERQTKGLIEPFTQSVVDSCPDVMFRVYGMPRYELTGTNVIHHAEDSLQPVG